MKGKVDEEVALLELELGCRPLSSLASGYSSSGEFKKNSLGTVLRHDYLVLTVVSQAGKQEKYLIEKLAKTQCGVLFGTKVNVVTHRTVENEKSA